MPKMIVKISPSPVSDASSQEIYDNSNSRNSHSKSKSSSKLKRSLTINISPILSRLRKIHKPAVHSENAEFDENRELRSSRYGGDTTMRSEYETKIQELERKAKEQLNVFNKRINEENNSNYQLKLNNLHKYKDTYADLSLAKKVLQTPEKVKISYEQIKVSESSNKYSEVNEVKPVIDQKRVANIKRYFSLKDMSEASQKSQNINQNIPKPAKVLHLKEAFIEPNAIIIKKTTSFSRLAQQPKNTVSPIYYD